MTQARETYLERLSARTGERDGLARFESRLSWVRLGVGLSGFVAAGFVFGPPEWSGAWVAVPALVFVALVVWHDRVLRGLDRAERGVRHYEHGLARVEDRWSGIGPTGDEFSDAEHPYAADLDLFGEGSLFQLLCLARTQAGEATLADWLCAPADPEEVRARQAAVQELRDRVALREELARVAEDVDRRLDPEALRAWASEPPRLAGRGRRVVAAVLASVSVATLAAWALDLLPLAAFGVAIAVQMVFASWLRADVLRVVRGVERPARDLAFFSELLAVVEAQPAAAPRLVSLRRALEVDGAPPSVQIARLARRVHLLDARRNQFFAPIGGLLLWTTQLAFAIEGWRAESGPKVGAWIDAMGEFEALSSLAAHAWERPEHAFPELVERPPRFHAEALGHPLLPAATRVQNDVRLGPEPAVLVVSGSNMSGKSTLLRTVGVASVMAFAGAPVCARALALTPMSVGASIRIQDSLQAGASRFYAEILRLKQVMQLAETRAPALFLLDEILHGTNSHDRGIGAEAVVRGLLERGAIGLVTTHDLALARVAEALGARARNVHFVDHLEEGRIAFDYRMREGVVERSNALELMRAVGLEV